MCDAFWNLRIWLSPAFPLQLRRCAFQYCVDDVFFYLLVIDSAWGFSCHSNINCFCDSSPHLVVFLGFYPRFLLSLGYCTFDSAICLRGCRQCTTRNNSFGIRCTCTAGAGLVPRDVGGFRFSRLWVVDQLSCIFPYFLGDFFMAFLFLCDISALG